MTYQPHALLRFGGTWFGTEQWSCGIRIGSDDGSATVANWVAETADTAALEPSNWSESLVQPVRDWFSRAGSLISQRATLNYVQVNAIGPDGRYADPGNPHTIDFAPEDVLTGPTGGQALPQAATVLSWRTAVQRGRATHGRIYAPTVFALIGSGRIAPADAQGMADSAAQLLEDIASTDTLLVPGQPRAVVASELGAPGPMRIITRVEVGDVVDTQRRRRNQLDEVYVTADVTTA